MRIMNSLCIVFLFVFHSNARANNNYFLPGDAFFPTELNTQDLEELRKADPKEYVINYSNFGSYKPTFCGYAGYSKAKFEALDKQFVEQLIVASNLIRDRALNRAKAAGIKNAKQTNTHILVMFYPDSFDYPKYELGLQYNENWVEECVKFGHSSEHLRLGELVDHKEAIIESWKRSKEVGTFKFQYFDTKKPPTDEANVENPIKIKGNIKAIVVDNSPLVDYVMGEKKQDVLLVENDGVYQFMVDKENYELVKTKVK